jgi:hypothetical protein
MLDSVKSKGYIIINCLEIPINDGIRLHDL